MNDQNCEALAQIISKYRFGEIPGIDGKHVKNWIGQFDEADQDIILEETIYVFSNWYFSKERILNEFLKQIPGILQKQYGFTSVKDTCEKVSFVKYQEHGLSQIKLVNAFEKYIQQEYAIQIRTDIDSAISHYVYLDDGLYTGKLVRDDICKLIPKLKLGDTLDAFFLVTSTQGKKWINEETKKLFGGKVDLHIESLRQLDNRHFPYMKTNNGVAEEMYDSSLCLWPNARLKADTEIFSYSESLKALGSGHEKVLFRINPWNNDQGVFSNFKRREVVEKAFLKKGIQIANSYSVNKGMYPLGFNSWPSFGFGAFCATEFNVPNTAPLVLWANNGNWYPLLPRRENLESKFLDPSKGISFRSKQEKSIQ